MKTIRFLLPVALLASACNRGDAGAPFDAAAEVHVLYTSMTDSLVLRIERLRDAVRSGDTTAARAAFHSARSAFKRIEFLAEYYNPETAKGLNGPPIAKNQEDDPSRRVLPPEGFQVVEERLFGEAAEGASSLAEEAGVLAANARRLQTFARSSPLNSGNIFDAARTELLRILALGLSGFDSPLVQRSLPEARDALRGTWAALAAYTKANPAGRHEQSLAARFESAIEALQQDTSFEAFDRLGFTTNQLIPLMHALDSLRLSLNVQLPAVPRAWRADVPTPFAANTFDAVFFAAPGSTPATAEQVALGAQLFHDRTLSGDGSRSCATCHRPDAAFAEPLRRSKSLRDDGTLRNAPTLLNAALQFGSFYDLRTAYLEEQVAAVLASPHEMAATTPAEPDVQVALAAYIRSLARTETPFDHYLRGDTSALSAEARNGFNVFMGKAKCGTCHFAPLFGGTLPPMFVDSEVEVLGVPATAKGRTIDPDIGRAAITRNPLHEHAFRTPSIREVGRTAPYMHNGVFATLEEVVDFYDVGGGAGLGIDVPNQTLPADSLKLTVREKKELVAFMKALSTK